MIYRDSLKDICKKKKNLIGLIRCTLQEFTIGDAKYIGEGVVIVLATSYLFYRNLLFSIILSPYVLLHLKERREVRIIDNKRKLDEKFKDALLSVSFALNAGYSVENGFKEAANEMAGLYGEKDIITRELSNISSRLDRNERLEDMLSELADETEVDDIRYFAEIFRYAKRSGGNLIAVIKNSADNIRDKTDTMQEINAMISGKKMEQKVMSVIPFVIIFYLRITTPEFIEPLYGNIPGVLVMTIALMMLVASDYISKRIINIEI